MLSPVEDRLKASISMDVINGDSFEKSIFIKQILEAIQTIEELRKLQHMGIRKQSGTGNIF